VDTGDLDAVQKSGELRVLVMGEGEVLLPRDGASSATDRELAALFAQSLGLKVVPIPVDRYEDLIPALLAGKGDLIASRMAATASRQALVAFSRPTAVVDELLVGRKGAANPKSPAELAGKTVTVRKSSSYRESLDALAASDAKGVVAADAPEDRDTEALVHDVGTGAIALTMCDSDLLDHILAYDDQVEALFPVATGRQIGWAMRPTNPALKAAADAFLVSWAMTTHAQKRSTGDLDQIAKRGSLRVLTRNNATSYFLNQGTQSGFDYELMKRFATEHGLRLDIVVPPDADQLVPWLLEGKGDVIAAQLAITPERAEKVAFSDPYLTVDEVLVQRADEDPIGVPADLKGRTIAVRKSSSYRRTLDALQPTAGPFTVQDVPEDLDTEQIIAKVASGELPMTLADSNLAQVEVAWGTAVQLTAKLVEREPVGYAVRKDNPALLAALNDWVEATVGTVDYNVIRKRYFEDPRMIGVSHADTRVTGEISPYDELIRRHARDYGLDWRLMASQAYQESRFDPHAKSWVGAVGLFQVMPATGRELGFSDLTDPEQGIHAGIRYLSRLIEQFDKRLPFKQRVRFALAAYNVGKGHVDDARRLAGEFGMDPDKWFGNVEQAMLKLQEQPYARRARYGYCRGQEPVHYVSEIQSRYENYLTVVKDLD
jgi:membrane-bound lytic murein transglycosylase F